MNNLREILKTNDVHVCFQKANKEIRHMICTLRPEVLPPTQGESTASSNPDNIVVWDLELQAWRCFNQTRLLQEPEIIC